MLSALDTLQLGVDKKCRVYGISKLFNMQDCFVFSMSTHFKAFYRVAHDNHIQYYFRCLINSEILSGIVSTQSTETTVFKLRTGLNIDNDLQIAVFFHLYSKDCTSDFGTGL